MKKKYKSKITVITPTHNRANLIGKTIESILSQSFDNFEYLILDDGSDDNTKEVVKPFLNDRRIKYLKHDNVGEAETVNWGWGMATGEFFTQVNSDDPILPGLFERMVKALDNNQEFVLAYPDFNIINSKEEVLQEVRSPNWNFLQALSNYSCYAASPGVFIRRSAFKKWDKIKKINFKYTNDVEMYWDMALIGDFLHVSEVLATWKSHDDAISSERYKSIPEIHMWYNKYFNKNSLPVKVRKCQNKTKQSIDKYCISLIKQSNLKNKNDAILKYECKYVYNNLQISDTDLVGNKFNGHDLHNYLRERDIDSRQLVWNKESQDKYTYEIAQNQLDRNEIYNTARLIQRNYFLNGIMNPLGYSILYNSLFLNAKIIHFHLIHNYIFDIQLLPVMTRLKPVVWTLHDPWALSGHCIHHFDCKKWKKQCSDCPSLEVPFSLKKDNSALNFSLKKEAIKNSNLEIIVASKWMERKVEQSPIFEGKKIHIIPFGVNQEIFNKTNKFEARKKLKVAEDALVISFRCDYSKFKGLDIIKHVLGRIKANKKIVLLVLASKLKQKINGFDVREYGWVKDDELLSQIYSASDLFLMPSVVESFGMMAIEAMSCGTLPIVLDGTALPEVVNAPECGVATRRNKDEYLKVVQYYIDHEKERDERAKKCLMFAKKNYNKDTYVDKLINVYEKAISEHQLSREDKMLLDQLKKHMAVKPVPQSNNSMKDQEVVVDKLPEPTSIKLSFKSKLREKLRKVIWMISPTFRMLAGNRHRMRTLLSKVENLENIFTKVDNLENSLNKKLAGVENSLNKKVENLEDDFGAKVENLENSISWLKKDYMLKEDNLDINLLGEVMYLLDDHKSVTRKYNCDGVEFFEKMKKFILQTDIILDIGPGIRPQTFFTPKVHICVEPFKQYRDVIQPLFPNQSHFIFMREGGLEAIKTLDDNSVDTIFMIDLIEHLEKKDGAQLIKEADRVARKQIIVFTPLGFYPMYFKGAGQKDAWGLDGTDVQEHKSGWLPKDFGNSWDFHICVDCHEAFLPEEKKLGKKYSALMAIKTKKFNGFSISDQTPDFVKSVHKARIIDGKEN